MRRVKGLLQQAHEQGLWAVCGYLFRRYLFEKKSFLYIKETLPANISEQLSTLPRALPSHYLANRKSKSSATIRNASTM